MARTPFTVMRMKNNCCPANNNHQQVSVVRDPDAFGAPLAKSSNGSNAFEEPTAAYRVSRPVLPDASLSAAVLASLQAELPATGAVAGLNATADSFYSSQVRFQRTKRELTLTTGV